MKDKRERAKYFGYFLVCFTALLLALEIAVAIINNSVTTVNLSGYAMTLIIIPAVTLALTSVIMYVFIKNTTGMQVLTDGLKKVANGDFSVELDTSKNRSFAQAYENFNKMAKELGSMRTLREDFIHEFSHEFKTPLCSIHGFADLLLENNATPEEQEKYLKIISAEAERLRELADGILMLSNLENSQFVGEKCNFRVDLQIKNCVILLEREWSSKNIDISLDLDEVTICGGDKLVNQLWMNVLSNAVKFTPKGGTVEVSLKREGKNAVVKIRDSGPGVSPEDMPFIFNKYYRSQSSGNVSGNGLGLAVCKRVCTMSGGDIKCVSSDGCGAEFIITLPL